MSTVTTIGSSTINPDLTRAISDMASKAKKQLADTGNLDGFSEEYTGQSGGEQVTISMKAMAMAGYDKSAGPDDQFLAFSVQESDALGSGNGGSGASLTIKNAQDIDAVAQSTEGVLEAATAPYTSTTYDASDYASGGALAGQSDGETASSQSSSAAATGVNGANPAFSALQQKQDATSRLVSALQDFLDGLRKSTSNSLSSAGSQSQSQNSTQSTLKNLLLRVDIKI